MKKFVIFCLFPVSLLFAQTIEEICKYYPLHIGDEWHYKISVYEADPEPLISYSTRNVIGDTVLQNGLNYFVINEDGHLLYERIDSLNLRVMRYDENSCENNEKDIYSLRFRRDSTMEWNDCVGLIWQISYYDSGGIEDSSQIRLSSDGLVSQEHYLSKGWGVNYISSQEICWCATVLISAVVAGRTWETLAIDEPEFIEDNITLFQNYPNPFNPSTIIKYYLKKREDVQLTVYDISGKAIKTFLLKSQPSGYHSLPFEAKGLAGGIYFYTLKAGSFKQSRKMLLLH